MSKFMPTGENVLINPKPKEEGHLIGVDTIELRKGVIVRKSLPLNAIAPHAGDVVLFPQGVGQEIEEDLNDDGNIVKLLVISINEIIAEI